MAYHVMLMVSFQSSLTQKLVPLLSKIRTKEPAVMVCSKLIFEPHAIYTHIIVDGDSWSTRGHGNEGRP